MCNLSLEPSVCSPLAKLRIGLDLISQNDCTCGDASHNCYHEQQAAQNTGSDFFQTNTLQMWNERELSRY